MSNEYEQAVHRKLPVFLIVFPKIDKIQNLTTHFQ